MQKESQRQRKREKEKDITKISEDSSVILYEGRSISKASILDGITEVSMTAGKKIWGKFHKSTTSPPNGPHVIMKSPPGTVTDAIYQRTSTGHWEPPLGTVKI